MIYMKSFYLHQHSITIKWLRPAANGYNINTRNVLIEIYSTYSVGIIALQNVQYLPLVNVVKIITCILKAKCNTCTHIILKFSNEVNYIDLCIATGIYIYLVILPYI